MPDNINVPDPFNVNPRLPLIAPEKVSVPLSVVVNVGAVPPLLVNMPAPFKLATVCEKAVVPLNKFNVPDAPMVNAVVVGNALRTPSMRLPALTVVAPL